MKRTNFMIYCTACIFATDDYDAMEAHILTHRVDHEALPMRAGTSTPETHTHYCSPCGARWDCDDPSCAEPDQAECDSHWLAIVGAE